MKSNSKTFLQPYKETENQIIFDYRTTTLDLLEVIYFGIPLIPVFVIGFVVVIVFYLPFIINVVSFFIIVLGVPLLFYLYLFLSKKRLIKFITISRSTIKFEYYSIFFDVIVKIPKDKLDIRIYSSDKSLYIKLLKHKIPFRNSADLPVFLESLEKYTQLEFDESQQISKGNELLKYKVLRKKQK